MGTKSKVATSALPSRGPTSGRGCYITPVFSGPPTKGAKSELAACHLPLHSRLLLSYGEKTEKTPSSLYHPCT